MIKLIYLKELMDILRSQRFRLIAAGFALISFLALFNGVQYYQSSNETAKTAADASYRQWLEQGEKNPHSGAHYGFYAYKPNPLMSVMDRGAVDFLGNVVWLEAHNQNEVKNPAAADGGALLRMGQLTLGFVLQCILPLILILLSYNQFTKETENGTLKLLLSTRISLRQLFAAKFLASYSVALVLLVPVLGIALGTMSSLDSSENWWSDVVPSFLYLTGSLMIFYALVTLISVSVSLRVSTSAVALVSLAGFWLIGVFLVPRFGSILAQEIYPTATSFEFDEQIALLKEKGVDGHGAPNQDLVAQTLKKYGVDSLSQLPVNFAAISLQVGEENAAAVYDVVYADLFGQFRKQEVWLRYVGLLSPFQAFRNLSMAVSGTDAHEHLRFANQAEDHRRMIQKTLNTYYETNTTGNETLWRSVPNFGYQKSSILERLTLVRLDALVLGIWLMLSFLFAGFCLRSFQLI